MFCSFNSCENPQFVIPVARIIEESSSISPTAGTFVPTLYISVNDIKDLKLVHEDQKDQATNSISISSLSRPNQLLSDRSPTLVAADGGKLKSYL